MTASNPGFGARTIVGQNLAAAWRKAAGRDLLPRRDALKPSLLKAVLPNIFILEYLNPMTLKFRLVGDRLTEMLGIQLTGLNCFDLVPAEQRPVRIARLKACAAKPCGVRYLQPATLTIIQAILIETVILPIRPNRPGPLQFIGAADMVQRLESTKENFIPHHHTYDRVAEDVAFLDIGCGIPEYDPGKPLFAV